MRWILLSLTLALPAWSAEICVEESLWWCCHPLCDVPELTAASGYSTVAPPSCDVYGEFTLSSSSVDPYQNQGGLSDPLGNLYLWLTTAAGGYGFSASEVTVSGNLPLWEFHALQPNVGFDPNTPPLATTWTFSVGCTFQAPILLANLVVVVPTTSTESYSWGRIKALWR